MSLSEAIIDGSIKMEHGYTLRFTEDYVLLNVERE